MHLSRTILLAITCAVSLSAGDAELALATGRTVRGEVVTDGAAGITLRMRSPVRGGVKQIEVSYAKTDILKRTDVPSPLQTYAERKERTPDTVPELLALAQWCYENCLREPARVHALRVLELDPEKVWAKRILDNCGFIEVDGKWIDEANYMKEKNLAKVDGVLVPVAVAEARKVLARAVASRESCSKLVQDLTAILAEKPGSANANEAKAKSLTKAVEAAKAQLEDTENKLAETRQLPPVKGNAADQRKVEIAQLETQLGKLRDKINESTKAASESNRLANRDKTSAEQAKTKLPDAIAALAKAEEDVKAAAAKLPVDDAAAKAALADPVKPVVAPAAETKDPVPQRQRGGGGGGRPPKDE